MWKQSVIFHCAEGGFALGSARSRSAGWNDKGRPSMNRRSIPCVLAAIVVGLGLPATAGTPASAAEIKLLSAVALHPAIDALLPDFEKSSGHKVTVAYGT